MHPIILSRRYAPAKSVQSSYLTLFGLRCIVAEHGIGGGGKNYDDSDSQPDASTAATSTATTTMHSTTALHTAFVAATCATLARSSTRTT
jgi:hypothetical protein